MASTFESTINAFYLAYYGRPADPSGLAFWSMQLQAADGDFGAIAGAFANSAEAQVRFGASDATARITQVYEQLYNRAPDAAGLAFWTNAIARGDMTMADAAIQILHGAQGSDAALATARQSAAEAFTAEAAASGVAYDGYAAIEAARVLVKAVTAATSAADVDAMVKATAKLVQIAHDKPQVVEAIAVGTTLEKLFDTARGHAEAVNLVRTLADVAAVAAGDPATLESLLRGGGMAKVLDVMPAAATLGDVVKALASGGLPAAVEVVYPTPVTPTVPAAPLKLAFVGVSEDPLHDTTHDNVTNVGSADVTFSYSRALKSNQHVEWSSDGGTTWHTDGFDLVAANRTIVIHDVDLTGASLPPPPPPRLDPEAGNRGFAPVDVTTTVQVRVVEGSNSKVVATIDKDIVYDHYVATPGVTFDTNATHENMIPDGVILTNKADYTVDGIEDGAKVEYLVTGNNANVARWIDTKPTLHEGDNTFTVRQTDKAGNVATREVTVRLDTAGPTTFVALALDADTGSSDSDQLTNSGKIKVTGLDKHTDTAWEYSLDQGKQWTSGGINDGSGADTLDLTALEDGAHKVWVRQYDAAGNLGTTISLLDFTLDTKAPDVTVTFDHVSGSLEGTPSVTTSGKADVTFSYTGQLDGNDIVEWREAGGEWTSSGLSRDDATHTFTIQEISTSGHDPLVQVRVGDAAGNFTTVVEQLIDGPYSEPVDTTLVSTLAVQNGLDLHLLDSKIYMSTSDTHIAGIMTAPRGSAQIAGMTGIQAQTVAVSGQLHLEGAQGPVDGFTYTLGTGGDDEILSGSYVWGFGGNDTITGTSGADHLFGGEGDDTFHATKGSDIVSGGTGHDTFRFDGGVSIPSVSQAGVISGITTITDFDSATDKLVFQSLYQNFPLSRAMTVSSTLYTSIDALVADAQAAMGRGDVAFAGQLGTDTYVLAKDATGGAAIPSYQLGIDSMVKLANFSAGSLGVATIDGISIVHADGKGDVVYAGSASDTEYEQTLSTPLYLHGRDIEERGYADTIVGGLGDDIIVGGKGGDMIVLTGGHDTLVYASPADSNLSGMTGTTPGMTFDMVNIDSSANIQKVSFAFGGGVLGAHTIAINPEQTGLSDMVAMLDLAYHQVATSRYDAVLVTLEGSSILLVNNGDDQIDGNDYAVALMGVGSIAMDDFGHVVYTPGSTNINP